ncbi:helix-turn-helix domain-containing protein [Mesobacillus stamsii]|uniref:Transcriptional regulator with XRE-family HTH domain n=1 Tax=Mesobacillus stamsii TaxID=225347 RepID=A0ABU0G1I3_9BACI|nr:helix-turn-helix transcriptional regulator [Mesobacillus stamsii]MDQ0415676.1 transcriptional regulator with XRE-family HTH domain [Mesobacillus stamsii]
MNNQRTLYIGKTVKRLRDGQKMNQEDLAFLSGLSREYISKIENDVHDPTLGKLVFIADALNMLTSDLVKAAEEDSQKL